MAYEIDLTNSITGYSETIIIDDCSCMDECISRVHSERPEQTIEFIGVAV